MTVTLDQIRCALAANLQAAYPDVNVSPYIFAAADPPCIDMMPDGATYNLDMGGQVKQMMCVRVMVPWNDTISAQQNLDGYCDVSSSSSVKAAIEVADGPQGQATLGGLVSWVRVTAVSGYKEYPHRQSQLADIPMKLGVEFTVEIHT